MDESKKIEILIVDDPEEEAKRELVEITRELVEMKRELVEVRSGSIDTKESSVKEAKEELVKASSRNSNSIRKDNIESDLKRQREKYKAAAHNHKKHQDFFGKIFYGIGYPQVILSLAITILTGSKHDSNNIDTTNTIAFVLGFLSSILSTTLVFFRIEEKSSDHKSAGRQFNELAKELRVFLLSRHTVEELEKQEEILLEKEKFIDSFAPNYYSRVKLKKVKTMYFK